MDIANLTILQARLNNINRQPLMRVLILACLLNVLFSGIVAAKSDQYIGSEACQNCHKQAFTDWQGSHHAKAMAHADSTSVLGDFADAKIEFNDETYRFYQQDDNYYARIKDAEGKFQSYQILYTFGVYPLQQYMVDIGQGKIQLIPFAWDSREKDTGGKRWFHLYPQALDPKHEFFWTNQGQNWNYMCADCHSTDIKKNYQAETDSYNTSFAEISVGCEACHGPGAEHVQFVSNKSASANITHKQFKGFDRSLHKLVSQWKPRENSAILQPVRADNADSSKQTLVCAQCHSRRLQLGDKDHIQTNELGDKYLLNLVEPGAYHPDGQIYDEVYVYGSYLQSKMHQQGVVCTNCHQPHSGELLVEGNALCNQCHLAESYDTPTHHNHPDSLEGSQCVDCHMPQTTYMQIDPRRDHRWHVPNPQQSANLQTPDVCLSCHNEKSSEWSISQVATWGENQSQQAQEFGPAFLGAEIGYPQSATWLSKIAQDVNYPAIIRASALQRSATVADNNTLVAISRGLKSKNTWVRTGAVRGTENLPINARWRLLSPLIDDPVLVVRIEVARALLSNWQQLTKDQQTKMQAALDDYVQVQSYNADRGFALTNLANLYAYQGNLSKAEQTYQQAIQTEPNYANSYLNLSEVYRQLRDETKVINILEQGKNKVSSSSALSYQLGLSYIRQQQPLAAQNNFAQAVTDEPENPQYQFVYGLSLKDTKPKQAQQAMSKAYTLSQNPQYLYALCEFQIQQQEYSAKQCVEQLRPLVTPEVIQQLEQQMNR
ncbi:tetratricopeptide repeat protein [Thalassotalea litorea]|uniref:Tetratricopeptide repeat protein n=1 Tax=Thalassotalea litorea TaxID=2020715 RepID=A0A5R9IRC3_9GAMM|nr:multiheme c-type cytochrome [Thalassotalea litorea]TLU68070.1 tetratricopeptide repeat protein [Thalassotalea litorea]